MLHTKQDTATKHANQLGEKFGVKKENGKYLGNIKEIPT